MSAPVEETPAAAAPAAEPVAAEPAAAATEAPTEAPAAAAAAETTEAAPAAETTEAAPAEGEAQEEVKPATEATLGYKGPGLVKGLRFAKRFVYFSDDAVESKNLSAYLASEKSSPAAQRTVAWATQTGKGLLFLAKRAEDKATPAGIFNLTEVSDINKEGANELSFKLNGQKHAFQAGSAAERDSWVSALTTKSTEAEAEKETITGSEGYKAELEKITKPAAPAAKAAAPEKESTVEDKKSRSQSRKRASIFGTILNKKEKEEAPATTEAAPAEETAAPAETAEAPAAETAPAEETTETAAATEDKKEEPKAAKAKRASIFGNLFNKVGSPSKEKTEEEVAPVASTAPQLDNPVDETAAAEPEAAAEAPAAEAATTEAAAETTENKEETTTPDKRRTSLFGTLGKKAKTESAEAEAKLTDRISGIFRRPSKAVKSQEDKKEAAPAETIPEGEDKPEPIAKDAPAEETAAPAETATETPAAAEPVNVASTAAPVQAAA